MLLDWIIHFNYSAFWCLVFIVTLMSVFFFSLCYCLPLYKHIIIISNNTGRNPQFFVCKGELQIVQVQKHIKTNFFFQENIKLTTLAMPTTGPKSLVIQLSPPKWLPGAISYTWLPPLQSIQIYCGGDAKIHYHSQND